MLGALLVLFVGISPAGEGIDMLSGDERPVMEATESASLEIDAHPEPWERFDAVETGAMPKPAQEELSLDDYHPD